MLGASAIILKTKIRIKKIATVACSVCGFLIPTTLADEIAAENLDGRIGITLPTFVGQSFTTGPAAEYSGLSFNFYLVTGNPASDPHADPSFTYYLLSREFLGRNDQLTTATPGFMATTTGVSGDQWVFNPSVTLLGNTRFWLYGGRNGQVPGFQQLAVGSNYSGGERYHSGGGPGNTFSIQTGHDMAFTINSHPVPDPIALAVAPQSDPVIDSGPLSFGLSELPAQPKPVFFLGEGSPAGGGATGYGLDDVVSARLAFGDGIFTRLTAFDMEVRADGTFEALSYTFAPLDTPSVSDGGIVMNSPLFISGTDTASGQAFSYTYTNSTATVILVPDPLPLALRVVGLTSDTLTLAVENILIGQTFHLRQSTDLTSFEPLSPPINITATTPQPMTITVDPTTLSPLFFTVYAGPSTGP